MAWSSVQEKYSSFEFVYDPVAKFQKTTEVLEKPCWKEPDRKDSDNDGKSRTGFSSRTILEKTGNIFDSPDFVFLP